MPSTKNSNIDSTQAQEAQPQPKKYPVTLKPGYTVMAHDLDLVWAMPKSKLSEKAKVALIVFVRWTDGNFHNPRCMLSIPQWMKLTGSTNKNTFEGAVQELVNAGIIKREDKPGPHNTSIYSLNPSYSSGIRSDTTDSEQRAPAVPKVIPLVVSEVILPPVPEVIPLDDSEVPEVLLHNAPSAQTESGAKASAKNSSSKTPEKTSKNTLSSGASPQEEPEREKMPVLEEELEEEWGRIPTPKETDLKRLLDSAKRSLETTKYYGPRKELLAEIKRLEREYIPLKNANIRAYLQEQAAYNAPSHSLPDNDASHAPREQLSIITYQTRASEPAASECQDLSEAAEQTIQRASVALPGEDVPDMPTMFQPSPPQRQIGMTAAQRQAHEERVRRQAATVSVGR